MSSNKTDCIIQTDVGVFWDYENVKVPNHYRTSEAVNAIRNAISSHGRVLEKRCYYDSKKLSEANTDRSTLDLCGFTLVDCPTRGRKETLDKKMIVDILGFAWERVGNKIPACVVLISSDGDYSYTLSKLRDIGVRTVVIHGMLNFAQILLDCCDVAISWHHVLFPPSGGVEEMNLDAVAIAGADNREPDALRMLSPPPALSREVSVATVADGSFQLLCHCVRTDQQRRAAAGQNDADVWAFDSAVGISYREKRGGRLHAGEYAAERENAIVGGFLQLGRRVLQSDGHITECADTKYDKLAMHNILSLELYLRLTPLGRELLDGTYQIPNAL